MRALKASFHSAAFSSNLKRVKSYSPNSKVMAVLKANAYGHGLIEAARALNDADGFSVLTLSEAIELREHGFTQHLLLLEGFFKPYEVKICSLMGIGAVIHHAQQIDYINQVKPVKPIDVHLKVNTGMNRLGFMPKDVDLILKQLEESPYINKIVIMTHFSDADGEKGVASQLACFNEIKGIDIYERSVANSAAIIKYPETHFEWVRPGIMLYGASPFDDKTGNDFQLKPVMSLRSEIIAIQTLEESQSVGYGSVFTAPHKMTVGIVACGYADGYPRHAPSGTPLMVDGVITQTVGRVSMDMLYVDLSSLPNAGVGSSVELWGKGVLVDEVARQSHTVGYELLCAISASNRVPMEYQHG